MQDHLQFYIDGQWVNPVSPRSLEVINPSNEQAIARISMGSAADVDKAVAAARRAFESYSRTSREERLRHAHDVLTNDKDLTWLKGEVERLHQFYLTLRGGQA